MCIKPKKKPPAVQAPPSTPVKKAPAQARSPEKDRENDVSHVSHAASTTIGAKSGVSDTRETRNSEDAARVEKEKEKPREQKSRETKEKEQKKEGDGSRKGNNASTVNKADLKEFKIDNDERDSDDTLKNVAKTMPEIDIDSRRKTKEEKSKEGGGGKGGQRSKETKERSREEGKKT